jgi:hypothetical protein
LTYNQTNKVEYRDLTYWLPTMRRFDKMQFEQALTDWSENLAIVTSLIGEAAGGIMGRVLNQQ